MKLTRNVLAAALAVCVGAALSAQTSDTIWRPAPRTTWQWQLTTPVDMTPDVQLYDVDLFDNDAATVAALHAVGRKAICYVSVGSWENWRPDANLFPASVKGKTNGWPGERWLDIRNLAVLGPILGARLDLCKAKGFDGVEPDNVDGYANDTGFRLTYADQIRFNTWIASAAHARGLSVGLKNDVDQIRDLQPLFDWALNEECFRYKECNTLAPFTQAGKAVFQVEYRGLASNICPKAQALGFNTLIKNKSLDAYAIACP
jgi:hypothetical protein